MKKAIAITVVMAAIGLVAQSGLQFSPQFWAQTPVGPLTGCPTPVSGSNILCSVTDGYYVSVSGTAYLKINAAAGVASFNGRTGNVLPTPGDYAYSDLKNPPSRVTCTTAQISAGGSGNFTASGCTIN